MGKLRDSLDNARKLIAGLKSTTEKFSLRLTSLTKQADTFLKGVDNAVSELAIYIMEKLKKKNIPFEKVKKAPLKTMMDPNVQNYLAGIQFVINETAKFNTEFEAVVNDKSIDNTLNALDPLVVNIAEQIRKKKKKLLQSKKYKVKITNYEGDLNSLRQVIRKCKEDLAEVRGLVPPRTLEEIRRLIGITENSTLAQVEGSMKPSASAAYTEYKSLILKLNQTALEIKYEKEFAQMMKSIQEMANNALEMEKEGGPD